MNKQLEILETTQQLTPLPPDIGSATNGYKTIVVDPPWKYGIWGGGSGKGKDMRKAQSFKPYTQNLPLPYPTMTIDEIKSLPIARVAADNCELYLWTTQKYLPVSFDVLEVWGFKYCQTITWCKKPRGTGQGGVYCPTTEFIVLGRKGKMPKVKRIDSTWFLTKRPNNSHSKKPEYFQDMIETVSEPPRLEIFARRKRDGWDVFGNEVESDIQLIGEKVF